MIALTRYDIWAQAENGSDYVYQFENCDGATCNEWIESTPASNFDPFMQSLINSGCESTYRYYAKDFNPIEPRYPPQNSGNPVQCAVIRENNPYNGAESLTYIVLLDDGNIWMWRHKADLPREFKLYLGSSFAGLIIGIVIWLPLQRNLSLLAGKF